MEEDEHGEMVQRYRLPRQSLVANVASQSGKKLLALAPCKLHSLHALHLGGALESEGHRRCDADHSTIFFFSEVSFCPQVTAEAFPGHRLVITEVRDVLRWIGLGPCLKC